MEHTRATVAASSARRTPTRYSYDAATVAELWKSISTERYRTYLRLASGDHRKAMCMYTLNVALGSALHGPLQTLEVALRNAVHDCLTDSHGGFWFRDERLLERSQLDATQRATRKVRKGTTAGHVVAELNFGFWVALFARRYDTRLWRTRLSGLFVPSPSRLELYDQLDRLRTLRNRVAHHEPILQRDLRTDYQKIIWILRMLSPDTASWTEHHSRVLEVLDLDYEQVSRF